MSSYCNTPDVRAMGAHLCQWPRGHVLTWNFVGGIAGFSRAEVLATFSDAWKLWENVSGVRTKYDDDANIVITTRRIDGPAGVLAEAQLPCGSIGPDSQLHVWFDRGDRWVNSANPPSGQMDLFRVAVHEFGHSLGIGHETSSEPAIMDPTVSHIRTLQPWDIAEVQKRYGAKSDPAPPKPEPPDDPEWEWVEKHVTAVEQGKTVTRVYRRK